MTTSLTAINLL